MVVKFRRWNKEMWNNIVHVRMGAAWIWLIIYSNNDEMSGYANTELVNWPPFISWMSRWSLEVIVLGILFGLKKHKVDECSTGRLLAKISLKLEENKIQSWFCRVLSDLGGTLCCPLFWDCCLRRKGSIGLLPAAAWTWALGRRMYTPYSWQFSCLRACIRLVTTGEPMDRETKKKMAGWCVPIWRL
jgi:hypothetical protein